MSTCNEKCQRGGEMDKNCRGTEKLARRPQGKRKKGRPFWWGMKKKGAREAADRRG